MDEDATWYGSRPRPRPHCILGGVLALRESPLPLPSNRHHRNNGDCQSIKALRERGTAARSLFSAHVYCGHGRPSQLLLSSCSVYDCIPLYTISDATPIYMNKDLHISYFCHIQSDECFLVNDLCSSRNCKHRRAATNRKHAQTP